MKLHAAEKISLVRLRRLRLSSNESQQNQELNEERGPCVMAR